MFRRFRLYMKPLVNSYTKLICGLLIWGREEVKCPLYPNLSLINDKLTVKGNEIFEAILQHDP